MPASMVLYPLLNDYLFEKSFTGLFIGHNCHHHTIKLWILQLVVSVQYRCTSLQSKKPDLMSVEACYKTASDSAHYHAINRLTLLPISSEETRSFNVFPSAPNYRPTHIRAMTNDCIVTSYIVWKSTPSASPCLFPTNAFLIFLLQSSGSVNGKTSPNSSCTASSIW